MAAQNLVNFYLNEELQDNIADVLLHTIFSLVLSDKHELTPLYYAVLLNSMVNMSRDNEKLKKMKQ
jgi:hypothetical protein